MMTRYYEYQHIVGFQETNLIGNVYYVHYLSWQGRCREMFLSDHAPSVLGSRSVSHVENQRSERR